MSLARDAGRDPESHDSDESGSPEDGDPQTAEIASRQRPKRSRVSDDLQLLGPPAVPPQYRAAQHHLRSATISNPTPLGVGSSPYTQLFGRCTRYVTNSNVLPVGRTVGLHLSVDLVCNHVD